MRDWPLERLQSVAGTRDVEYVADLSLVVVVVGFAMGQLVGDEIVCHGAYGQLEDAIRAL